MSEWLKISPVGRTATYEDIAAGRLRAVKRGHATLILAVDGAAYLASLPEWTSSPATLARNPPKRPMSTVAQNQKDRPRACAHRRCPTQTHLPYLGAFRKTGTMND